MDFAGGDIMKKLIGILSIIAVLSVLVVPSFAGMPQNHGVSGRDFGEAVSGMEPGAISYHVSNR